MNLQQERIIKKVENILIQTKALRLPEKRPIQDDGQLETVLVDVSETSIERPKKNKKFQWQKEKAYFKSPNNC